MKTYKNTEYTIGSTKNTDGTIGYHIMWLDTGSRTMGFVSYEEATAKADSICLNAELRAK